MNKLYEEIDKAIEMGFGNERYFTARVLREAKAKIVELEAEVESLRELAVVVKRFIVVRPTQIQAYGLEAYKLINRMAELTTEAGGSGK